VRVLDRYRSVVDRCEALARAKPGRAASIGELCELAGVGRRTLLRAFRAVHAATPSQRFRQLRMLAIRDALLRAHYRETVTEIATRFGVRELGRFAVEYRAAFGESPSETLERSEA
jgi:AraC-like DNA-binding protein